MVRRLDRQHASVRPLWDAGQAVQDPAALADLRDAAAPPVEDVFHAARERGYQQGYEEGEQRARQQVLAQAQEQAALAARQHAHAVAELEQVRQQLDALISALPATLAEQAQSAQEVAVSAAYAATVRMLGQAYADGQLMQPWVIQALADMQQPADALHLAPQDMPHVVAPEGVRLVADARLQPGQCLLRTRLGHYESGLDVRLETLRTALLAGLARHRREDAA
jgi:flagellar biosynthesis/type III secretory pathway protein FliH